MFSYILIAWIAAVIWAVFTIVPPVEGLGNTVRLAFFHIPTAWVSVLAFILSAYWAYCYLKTREFVYDIKSAVAAVLGFAFSLIATISGSIFAKLTWGAYWNWDPRQTSIFVLLLIYGAYLTLRSSIEENEIRARLCAVYSLLASVSVPFLIFIIPRLTYSLHPEPLINSTGKFHMDAGMLYVLLAAVIGCTGVFWRLHRYWYCRKAETRNKAARSEVL